MRREDVLGRVEDIDVSAYCVPTQTPEADGTLSWDSTTLVLVRATSGGTTGLGWTYGPVAGGRFVEEKLRDVVVGSGVAGVTATYHRMVRSVRNAGRPGIASLAISAMDTALWDLKARLLDLPLHSLLGAVRDEVPIYGSGGFTTFDDAQTEKQLTGWLDNGIRQVKIKIGEAAGNRTDRDLHRIALARRVVGDGVGLFVDANGAYTPKQAVRIAHEFAAHVVSWFEEPVTSDDLQGLALVRDATSCDVTAGEYGYDLTYFQCMCAAGAVDCLQIDATRCGGYSEWQRAAAVAAGHHLEVSAHCAPNLHAPVAAATPNLRHVEWFADHVRIEQLLFDNARDGAFGMMPVGNEPGHGLVLRDATAVKYQVAP
jgi:L-alanine-DL-glutamate epimerase-like enolase superfamily enzyme